ncbi:MAG: hypothetical protein WCS77_08455 [Elusimicrobiaceae bacterium]
MNILKIGEKLGGISAAPLEKMNFVTRLWNKDATIWTPQPDEETKNRMGWLTVPNFMESRAVELESFAAEIAREFTAVVVLGMGGSSLAPEVFSRIFPRREGYPVLKVLDSTNPEWVAETAKSIDIKKTVFIYSSKSGGTVEPDSFYRYFWSELAKVSRKPGKNFIAITDKGTSLESLAMKEGFRNIFINPSDIGGRFSVLSYFGLVPAALMGVDIKKLLARALAAAEICRRTDLAQNDGAMLGLLLGQSALSGRDKLTILTPPELETFGLWIEQLIGESTGKNGRGIVPIAGEETGKNTVFGNDRVFVGIGLKNAAALNRLEEKGHPTAELKMADIYDLGAQFMLWEVATAAAGAVMGINPYDQPDVQLAKKMAQEVLASYDPSSKQAPSGKTEITLSAVYGNMKATPENWAETLAKSVKPGDYIGILAYTPEMDALVKKFRAEIGKKTDCATLFGYGPRYLHSTGQLHKGGANNGIFLIITCDPARDVAIPGQKFTFDGLCAAQARGDFKALEDKGRRAIRLHLPVPCQDSMAAIVAALSGTKKSEGRKMTVKTKTTKSTKTVTAAKTAAPAKTEKKMTVKKAAAPKTTAEKYQVNEPTPVELVNAYVTIDHPTYDETIEQGHYVFRVGASENGYVEINVNKTEWKPCRYSVGYWWYDWNATSGTHNVAARIVTPNGELATKQKRFKVKG